MWEEYAPKKRRSALKQIRSAASQLTRVVVDLGHGQPRLESFVDSVRGRGSKAELCLAPIATDAIAPTHSSQTVRVRSVDARDPFCVVAKGIRTERDALAVVPLARAETQSMSLRNANRWQSGPRRQPVVLVVPGGLDDIDAHVFPVYDLSSSVCSIETSKPLAPQTKLDPVEVIGERRLLRRAHANVLETIPWRTPDGHARFRIRLELNETTAQARTAHRYDRVSEPDRVRKLVELAVLVGTDGWVETPHWGRIACSLTQEENMCLTLKFARPAASLARPQQVRVGFELFAVQYEADLRVIRYKASTVTAALPVMLRRRRQRYEQRVPMSGEDTVLRFTNPATNQREQRSLYDISFGGLCFYCDRFQDILWPDLPLEGVSVHWDDRRIELGEIEVRALEKDHQGRQLCHAAFRTPGSAESNDLVELIARVRHPHMIAHDGMNFADMVTLYKRVGLFGPHMDRNLAPVMADAARTWEKMHRRGGDLCHTVVQRERDIPVAGVSLVRAWERSWVIQHMVAAASRPRRTPPGELHMSYLDHILPRQDGHYMVVFVKADNAKITGFLERFFELSGTPEAVSRRNLEFWTLRPGAWRPTQTLSADIAVRPARTSDESLIARAAERLLGRLGAASLSMLEGELSIPETAKTFSRANVERSRRCSIVKKDSRPAIALIEERASTGFNLTWMLNATWILPIHPDRDLDGSAMRSAVEFVARSSSATPIGDRFAIVLEGTDTTPLREQGFELEAPVLLNSYNRAGLHRWYYYIRERYGEITALRLLRHREAPEARASA